MGKHAVVFAINAIFLCRAPVLQALCIVSQAWSTMKIPLGILTEFQKLKTFLINLIVDT